MNFGALFPIVCCCRLSRIKDTYFRAGEAMTTSKENGVTYSAEVTTFLANLKKDTSTEPRMLTELEVKCLRQQKQEIQNYVRQRMVEDGFIRGMLTPSEIKDLQQNKRESIQKMRELLAGNDF